MFRPSSGLSVTVALVPSYPSLHAVVYDGDPSSRRAATVIVERSGIEIVDVGVGRTDILERVRELRPELIILEFALAGAMGLGIVPALAGAVPGTAVVLLSPFSGLREPALAAGAYDFVDDRDLRDLRRCVRRLVMERRAREAQCEPPVPIHEVAAMGPGEGAGDGEAESGAAPAVEADEPLKDALGHTVRNP